MVLNLLLVSVYDMTIKKNEPVFKSLLTWSMHRKWMHFQDYTGRDQKVWDLKILIHKNIFLINYIDMFIYKF